ncbi:peptidoglycan DD-metalloendopeptidase family protein [Aeromonas dhakensis]|uniref:peptidoglycan DD-metalloendopeptidase family protein n=1 Tax=Aeromonas dhakensis TaxID=196024 RepID=UPI00191E1A45|nr:M23 family metallopeptidase [Aeromonas dhakensis]MBL0678444.1 M23 family metallopeptidase [Aeromonas dhakensis]
MSFDIAMNLILPPRDGKKAHITAPFGEKRVSGPHKGVDFNYIGGQSGINMEHPAAFSPVDGKVIFSGGSFGTVKILDKKGFSHEILHLFSQNVKEGESVKAGVTQIGKMGGRGPQKIDQYAMHIHYQIKDSSGKIVNPQEWWANKDATSNSNPIDVKPIASPCLPITQADGKEFKDAKSLASILGSEANYLLGLNTWHGGIHISDKKAPWVKDIYPVRCMADGEVVAFRMMPDYLASNFKGQEYRYSNSFCLVRHHFKQPKSAEGNKGSTQKENSSEKGGSTEDNGFTYYTLYMHLCPWDKWPKNSRYRLKKGWRVRHSVPNHDYQPPALTLKAGEEFELVEGVTAQRGYVTGQGEFEFARIKVLSNGASSKEVLATKGMDSLWMAQDPSAIEKVGNIVRPMWVYDKIEARVKEDMVGRADPQAQKGKTGHYVAGESVSSVPAGSLISFDAHSCEWQEVRGRARRMARCVVQPLGRPVWLCVEEENIEIKRQEPTHLGKLYELPTPVPIRAGETIGYLGMYEAPTSTEGGMSSKHMVHIELFSDDPRAEAVVSSKEWKDKGFTLIDGSDSDGALDPAKIPPFFLNLYRHASDDKELKDNGLTVKKLENAVDSIENYDRVKGMVVKHSSEWWVPASKVMMEQFKNIFCKVTDLPPLIEHEVKRVEELGWMDKLRHVHIAGPEVLHFYPLSIKCKTVVKRELIWMKRVLELYGFQIGEAFRNKVIKVGEELGIDPNYIMACIALETGTKFDPSIKNPYSSATGLIQLMRARAKELGTTVEELAKMDHVEQMDYVKMYFVRMADMFGVPTNRWSLEDVYLSIFAPSAIAIDGNAPVYTSPSESYNRNKFHDLDGDGKIMKSEIANNIRVFYDKGFAYEG